MRSQSEERKRELAHVPFGAAEALADSLFGFTAEHDQASTRIFYVSDYVRRAHAAYETTAPR
jgi:predicted TPR repeat methyltransferase